MPLPPEWVAKASKSHEGRRFYYNKLTKKVQWEKPPMVEDEDYPEVNLDEPQQSRPTVDPYLEDLNASLNNSSKVKHSYVVRDNKRRRTNLPKCTPSATNQNSLSHSRDAQQPTAAHAASVSKYTPSKAINDKQGTDTISVKCSKSATCHPFISRPPVKFKVIPLKKSQDMVKTEDLKRGKSCKTKKTVRETPYSKIKPDKHGSANSRKTAPSIFHPIIPMIISTESRPNIDPGSCSSATATSIVPSPPEPEYMEVDVEPEEAISSVMFLRKRGVKECGKSFVEIGNDNNNNNNSNNVDIIDVVVIDTNVLISHFKMLQSLLLRKASGESSQVDIIRSYLQARDSANNTI